MTSQRHAGQTHINSHGMLNPIVPFGGFKSAGYGVEFGLEGRKSMASTKVVSLTKAPA